MATNQEKNQFYQILIKFFSHKRNKLLLCPVIIDGMYKKVTLRKQIYIRGSKYKKIDPKMPKNGIKNTEKISFIKFS